MVILTGNKEIGSIIDTGRSLKKQAAVEDLISFERIHPGIKLIRPQPPFEEDIAVRGYPKELIKVLDERWIYEDVNHRLLLQFLDGHYFHLGQLHLGYKPAETKVLRLFEVANRNGQSIIQNHLFVRYPDQLSDTSIPSEIISHYFPE